jgi:surface protein
LKDSKKGEDGVKDVDEVEDEGRGVEAVTETETASDSEVVAGQGTDKRAALCDTSTDAHGSADGVALSESVGGAEAIVVPCNAVISGRARAGNTNIFMEENFYLLHWIYRIRNASCQRGLRISHFQPDFLWSMYRSMMRSKKLLCRTDGDIHVAADLWCFDRAAAEERYGHISEWDVSSVTDMSKLFQGCIPGQPMKVRFRGKNVFNDDISRWDVSHVTDMSHMFYSAQAFDKPIGEWDVSKVKNTSQMFYVARSFNQPVGDWDVSNVTDMRGMFGGARAFNQDLTRWNVNVRRAKDIRSMFSGALAMQRDKKPAAARCYDNDDDDDDDDDDNSGCSDNSGYSDYSGYSF